jgi:hypothetical protein
LWKDIYDTVESNDVISIVESKNIHHTKMSFTLDNPASDLFVDALGNKSIPIKDVYVPFNFVSTKQANGKYLHTLDFSDLLPPGKTVEDYLNTEGSMTGVYGITDIMVHSSNGDTIDFAFTENNQGWSKTDKTQVINMNAVTTTYNMWEHDEYSMRIWVNNTNTII